MHILPILAAILPDTGAVMFGFSIKDNNAVGKVAALKTFAAGAIVVSVSGILHTFI